MTCIKCHKQKPHMVQMCAECYRKNMEHEIARFSAAKIISKLLQMHNLTSDYVTLRKGVRECMWCGGRPELIDHINDRVVTIHDQYKCPNPECGIYQARRFEEGKIESPFTELRKRVNALKDKAHGLQTEFLYSDPNAARANAHYVNAYQEILELIDEVEK